MSHPFLETYRCGDCSGRAYRDNFDGSGDDDRCQACGGSGRRLEIVLGNLTSGHSFRVHDLLLQVTSDGDVRGRFDRWPAGQWQDVTTTEGLHTMLREVAAPRRKRTPKGGKGLDKAIADAKKRWGLS